MAGSAALLGAIAGCTGDDGGNGGNGGDGNGGGNGDSGDGDPSGNGGSQEVYDLTMGIGGQGTVGGNSGQSLQRVIDNVGEQVSYVGQFTESDPASIYLYNDGQLDGYTSGSFVIRLALEEEGAFSERSADDLALQGFTHGILPCHFMAVEGSGIETYDDLIGANVWAFPPAWGMREITMRMFQKAGMWEDMEPTVQPIALGDVAGAVEEGRIDALTIYGANYRGLAGWVQDVMVRDDFYSVEMTDPVRDAIGEQPGMTMDPVDQSDLYGNLDMDPGADTIDCFSLTYNHYFGREIPDYAVKAVCEISHTNLENLREGMPNYLDHTDLDNMTVGLNDDVAVHPGAEEFYKENDVWDDEWETA